MKKSHSFLIAVAVCLLASCTGMDEYKKITGDNEILYTGKIDSVRIYPGDGRLQITGLCQSDPKIVKCRVYWNLRKDSVDIPVDMSAGPFTVSQMLYLPEQTYNFEIFTYDAEGNRSIPVNITGKTYGDKYKASISNRLIRSFVMDGENGFIEWRELDSTTGAFETEVTYTDKQNRTVNLTVPVTDTFTTLSLYKELSEIRYTTLYVPDEFSLDTFRSATDTAVND